MPTSKKSVKSSKPERAQMTDLSATTLAPSSFADFGPAFIQTILSKEILYNQLRQHLPKFIPIAMNGIQLGSAKPSVDTGPDPAVSECTMVYQIPLRIKLQIPLYDAEPATVLNLIVRVLEPATLFLDIKYLQWQDIDMKLLPLDPRGWLIASQIASAINTSIDASATSRRLDLLHMVREQLAAGSSKPGAPPSTALVPYGRDQIVTGTLGPLEKRLFSVLLEAKEQVTFQIYAQFAKPVNYVTTVERPWFGLYGLGITGPPPKPALLDSAELVEYDEIYNRLDVDFTAQQAGEYRFSLQLRRDTVTAANKSDFRFKIKQRRTLPQQNAKEICFREFGANFLTGTMTSQLLFQELQKRLPSTVQSKPFNQPTDDPDKPAMVTAISQLTLGGVDALAIDPDPLTRSDLPFQAHLDIDVTLYIDLTATTIQPDHPEKHLMVWHIKASAVLFLHVHTALDPPTEKKPTLDPAMVIDVDPVKSLQITVHSDNIQLDETWSLWPDWLTPDLMRTAVTQKIQEGIADNIKQQLADTDSRTIRIQDQVAGLLLPAVITDPGMEPAILFPPTWAAFTPWKDAVGAAHTGHKAIWLEKDEKVQFEVNLNRQIHEGYDGLVAFGLCDVEFGVLSGWWQGLMVTGANTRKAPPSDIFTVPTTGT